MRRQEVFNVVDNSAGAQVLADSEAALTAVRRRDTTSKITPLRASIGTSVKRRAERTVRLHHQTDGWSVNLKAADVQRSGVAG